MAHHKIWLAYPLAVLCLTSCGHGATPPLVKSSFSRFVPGDRNGEGQLQTAIVTYQDRRGTEVSLVSAVHIGDGAYYDTLERYFATRDAVLYELIASPGQVPRAGEKSSGVLSFFQRALKNFLDLEFQLDAIDYTPENFVHADLSPQEFARRQAERGESLLGLMFKLMVEQWKQMQKGNASGVTEFHLLAALLSDDHARTLKFLLAQELEKLEALLAGLGEDGEGSVIVSDRNQKAIEVLRREMKSGKKHLSIFYGAAHMPDLEARLTRWGFRKKKQEWVTAWDVRSKKKKKK